MSVGFVTASGKGITVSEKALQKARHLFEQLDDDDSSVQATTGNTNNACCSSLANE